LRRPIPRASIVATGNDLAKFTAPDAAIDLEVLPTDGSATNLEHLRYDLGVKLASIQANPYQAFVKKAAAGKRHCQNENHAAADSPAAVQHRNSS